MQENLYWNGNGKYQKENYQLEKLIPDMGYSDNEYLNLYIATCRRYYDLYNNDLGNEDVLYDYCIGKIEPLLNKIDCKDDIKHCFTKNRLSIEEYEEPIYVYDEENDCETDEIDYYETKEEEIIEDLTEEEYEKFEMFVDAVIKLCTEKLL